MKKIEIPEDVKFPPKTLILGNGKEVAEWSFASLFASVSTQFPLNNAAESAAFVGCCSKLRDVSAGSVRALTDTEHECLCTALKASLKNFPPELLMHIPHYIHSILGAQPMTEEQAAALPAAKQNGAQLQAVS
jgi:protease inhibitor/seed storage/LTP family protein